VTEGAPSGPVLDSGRLALRPPQPVDYQLLFDWYSDPERVAPFDRFAASTWDGFVAEIEASEKDPASLAARFTVVRKSDGRTIGAVGHYLAHPVLTILDVWYLMGDPSVRGQGYGSEAVGLLVTHLFATRSVARVGATCDVENVPSARLLERLGFRLEGTLRSALYHHGAWHDVRVYGVTRGEWRPPMPRA
jgi:[ribosomal protein S5]-alanine N-acetyltransferase